MKNKSKKVREAVKPVPVESPAKNPVAFNIRCMIDLQLYSIVKKLRPLLAKLDGKVLDVGAGQSPWRAWLPSTASYQGLDVSYTDEFGMKNHSDITFYDGTIMPFENHTFDSVLCIEVLEHASDPQQLLREIKRVLKNEGILLLSVPWSARCHHIPYDYHRFTKERLMILLSDEGFKDINISERGTDIGVIANKLIILSWRLLTPSSFLNILWSVPLGICCGLLSLPFIISAHIAEIIETGHQNDPLGYFVSAKSDGLFKEEQI